MAYNYQYSKPFSQNGAPVAAVNLRTDLIGVSVPTTVSATAPWGHISKDKTLEAFQKYFFAEVKLEGIGVYDIFKVGGGIIGKGTTDDPIILDKEWLDDRYMPSFNFPISQVGDPSDFLLPISGSYFSVTFPLGGLPYHATAFVEGNGDLKLLHHVTNGEELRPVYAVWKDYRNKPISTMQITDVVYRPPGLDANEFVHNVHPASDSAMVCSLYRPEGFQEHIIVLLNGTMTANYHQFIRIGHQVFTVMLESVFSYANLKNIDATSINAIVGADGKIYLGMMLYPNNAMTGATSSMVVARVDVDASGNATLTAMTNTSTTNHNGNVRNYSGNGFIMHQEISTTDRSANKDAMYFTSPGINWTAGAGVSVSPSNSSNFAGLTPDGKIIVAIRYYHWCLTSPPNVVTRAVKPIFYYLLDPSTRTLKALDDSVGNHDWGIVLDENNSPVITRGGLEYYNGHYIAGGSILQLLPDGTRLIHVTPASADVDHTLITYWKPEITTALDGARDSLFSSPKGTSRNLHPVTPTPLAANRAAWLMNNNLIASNGPPNGSNTDRPLVRAKLIGNPTDKTYRLLSMGTGAPPVDTRGYNLNNDRIITPGKLKTGVFVFINNDIPYYHTAYWTSGVTELGNPGLYDFNDLHENGKRYFLDQTIIDYFDNLKDNIVKPVPEYDKVLDYSWSLVGPHPSVGSKKCILRYVISFYKDDPKPPTFRKYLEECHQGIAHIPCTLITNPDGSVKITAIDTTKVPLTTTKFNNHYVLGSGVTNLGFGAGTIQIRPDGSHWCNWGSNGNSGTSAGTGFETRVHYSVGFKPDGTIEWSEKGIAGTNTVTWHKLLGLGYVNPVAGLGAMYEFRPLTEKGAYDIDRPATILTSSRPAAGFSMTVSADIPVYVTGAMKYIRQQILDLRDTKADPRWSVFYISAEVSASPDAELVITLDPPVDTENRIYLGKIVTNETEITEMVLEPVTRWEGKRVSTEALGSSIIVSTGFPGGPGEITAISAGIDPTRFQGNVGYDTAAKTVTVTNSGSFYIQDKDLAITRFGNFEQTFISIGTTNGRCWVNGVEIRSGEGSSSEVVNRNALLRDGWNTVSVNSGSLTIRGPFLKR